MNILSFGGTLQQFPVGRQHEQGTKQLGQLALPTDNREPKFNKNTTKQGMIAHSCNPGTWYIEAGDCPKFEASGARQLQPAWTSYISCLKNQEELERRLNG